jgi:hypothetical protein
VHGEAQVLPPEMTGDASWRRGLDYFAAVVLFFSDGGLTM